MGDLIGMGSLDHKNFGALHPQFWTARTAIGDQCFPGFPQRLTIEFIKGKKDKGRYSSSWGTPPQNYGTSLAIWAHTVLTATRHK